MTEDFFLLSEHRTPARDTSLCKKKAVNLNDTQVVACTSKYSVRSKLVCNDCCWCVSKWWWQKQHTDHLIPVLEVQFYSHVYHSHESWSCLHAFKDPREHSGWSRSGYSSGPKCKKQRERMAWEIWTNAEYNWYNMIIKNNNSKKEGRERNEYLMKDKY